MTFSIGDIPLQNYDKFRRRARSYCFIDDIARNLVFEAMYVTDELYETMQNVQLDVLIFRMIEMTKAVQQCRSGDFVGELGRVGHSQILTRSS